MKKFSLIMALGISLALITGCANVTSASADVARTLPNGVTLSADEVAQLEALAPQALAIQRSLGVSLDGSTTQKDIELLRVGYNSLLMNHFGTGWQKYVFDEKSIEDFDPDSGNVTSTLSLTPVDPETGKVIPGRWAQINDQQVEKNRFVRQLWEHVVWPWAAVNIMNTEFWVKNPLFGNWEQRVVDRVSSQVEDARGLGTEISLNNSSSSGIAQGIPDNHWFPQTIKFIAHSKVKWGTENILFDYTYN